MTGLALVVTFLTVVINDRVGSENSTFAPLTAYLQSPWISTYDANGRLKGFWFYSKRGSY
jgi:hypothetical protein